MRAIGIDLGGTNLRAGVIDVAGELHHFQRRSTNREDSSALINDLVEVIASLDDIVGELLPIGIGAAGMVDRQGTMRNAPNIPGLSEVALGELLADTVGRPVVIENDASAAAWGEFRYGALRGTSHGIVVTLGTGVGGGIILNSELLRGAHGFAGEIGHFQVADAGVRCACGGQDHWECYASGTALGLIVAERVGSDLDAATITERFQAGDSAVYEAVERYARWVARGAAGLVNIFDPERLIFSGGVVDLGTPFLEMLQRHMGDGMEAAHARTNLHIGIAKLGTHAGLIGAAELASDQQISTTQNGDPR